MKDVTGYLYCFVLKKSTRRFVFINGKLTFREYYYTCGS